jgi:hypothetical protein
MLNQKRRYRFNRHKGTRKKKFDRERTEVAGEELPTEQARSKKNGEVMATSPPRLSLHQGRAMASKKAARRSYHEHSQGRRKIISM